LTLETVTLYRPVGPNEFELIRASGWRRFPPRLAHQPIFYPVVEEEYAVRIARDWNVPESGSGFVTRFAVAANFLRRYRVQEAGGRQFTEYWIPAEDLDEFNRHLVDRIEVIASFGSPLRPPRPPDLDDRGDQGEHDDGDDDGVEVVADEG
jgi:hypothetical protein